MHLNPPRDPRNKSRPRGHRRFCWTAFLPERSWLMYRLRPRLFGAGTVADIEHRNALARQLYWTGSLLVQ